MNKKRIIALSILLLMAVTPIVEKADAQVFIVTEEEFLNSDRNRITDGQLPFVPNLNVTIDQYAPLGGGAWLLGCLGGAYLLGKRRKKG